MKRHLSLLVALGAVLLTGCATAHSTPGNDLPYIDRRINGDRVTYRHMKVATVTVAVTREAIKYCKERGREAFLVATYEYSYTQRLSSFDCRKPSSGS